MKPTGDNFAKKRYHKPLLQEYGDIRQITRTNLKGAKDDGGSEIGQKKTG